MVSAKGEGLKLKNKEGARPGTQPGGQKKSLQVANNFYIKKLWKESAKRTKGEETTTIFPRMLKKEDAQRAEGKARDSPRLIG